LYLKFTLSVPGRIVAGQTKQGGLTFYYKQPFSWVKTF